MKGKKACAAAAAGAVICIAAGMGFYFLRQQDAEPEIPVLPEGMSLSEGVVSASGLTSVGMLEETYELGFLEDGLYVEETYLNMGDEVEEGTAVFKVSEESLESARRELEKRVRETALTRRQGAITYETGLLDAQKEKDLAAVEASYAQSVYDDAVSEAQKEVDALQEKVDEAQEKVNEYTASIEEDYYYTYYEVAQKEADWKENAAFLMELYEEWDVEWLQDMYKGYENGTGYVTNQVTGTGGASASRQGDSSVSGQGDGSVSGQGNGSVSDIRSGGSGDSSGAAGDYFSEETTAGVYFTEEQARSASQDGAEESESGGSEGSGSEGNGSEGSGSEGNGSEGGGSEGNGSEGGESGGNGSESGGSESSGSESSGSEGGESESGGNESGGIGDGESGTGDGGSGIVKEETGGGTASDGGMNAGDGSGSGFLSEPGGGMEMGGSDVSDNSIRYNIYLSMEAETEESEQAYETALKNYENAKKTAEAGIGEAKSELAVLQAQLKEQQTAYEQALITAKLTYDLAVSDNENAQMVYESTVKQLEEDYEALQEEEETAAENLALFEATIGDGVFYTGSAGTVMMTAVRASQWIMEDTVVIAYSNPDTVTISASVDQADIASVEIGQEAYVLISGYGSYTGKITSINPVSSSEGSSVSYTVNVRLEGDISALEANLTAYVYLGLTEEEQEMMSGAADGRDGANPENSESSGFPGDGGAEGFSGEMPEESGSNMEGGAGEDGVSGSTENGKGSGFPGGAGGGENGSFPEGGGSEGFYGGMPDGNDAGRGGQ